MLESAIATKAKYWATDTVFDHKTRNEISTLIKENNEDELIERFYRDLEFGTGGLRGILGAGSNRMNIYNVRKATQALINYLQNVVPTNLSHDDKETQGLSRKQGAFKGRIAIAYDSRHGSQEFAQGAAEVIAANGFQAHITRELRPVPMLSFMVRHLNCVAGICITASHNPPEYNGFKVYWGDGGQLVPPHDKKIIGEYHQLSDYSSIIRLPFSDGIESERIIWQGGELDEAYFSKVLSLSLNPEGRQNFKIVYSSLHGSGLHPVTTMLKRYGFRDVHVVEQQSAPDGAFPTVKSPNPEDPRAMELALALGKKLEADLILATDPDADRVGAIVREEKQYLILNGNQIASLLCDYILGQMKQRGLLQRNDMVVKTIVTTDLLASIAQYYQVACFDTLTGFKWICDLIERNSHVANEPQYRFICGGEESYGFLAGDFVRDKDAVITCSLLAEMFAWYKQQGLSVSMVLDRLFKQFGIHLESLQTLTLKGRAGAEKIAKLMAQFRSHPPTKLGQAQLGMVDDYLTLERRKLQSNMKDSTEKIELPKSDVLQFYFTHEQKNIKISIRPSGTEPKIKFYFALSCKPRTFKNDFEYRDELGKCRTLLEEVEKAVLGLCADI